MIRVGTTCTVYAFSRTVQFGLPGTESTQYVLFSKCIIARSHWLVISQKIYVQRCESGMHIFKSMVIWQSLNKIWQSLYKIWQSPYKIKKNNYKWHFNIWFLCFFCVVKFKLIFLKCWIGCEFCKSTVN